MASGTPKKGRGSDVVVTFGEDTPPGNTGTEGASSADGTTEKDSGLIARGVDGDRPWEMERNDMVASDQLINGLKRLSQLYPRTRSQGESRRVTNKS